MQASYKILCLSGSLRKNSCNTGLLRYILTLAPSFPQVQFEFLSLLDLPMYNGDFDPTEFRASPSAKAWPAPVQNLRDKAEKADYLIFAVSENNSNISPVLINAISWASRPEKVIRDGKETSIQPIVGKKVGLVSAAGKMGGIYAQEKLRSMAYLKYEFIDLKSGPLGFNCFAPGAFDANGDLVDKEMKSQVKAFLENFVNEASKK